MNLAHRKAAPERAEWTPANVDTLTRMRWERVSFSKIAAAIGTTRNACIGKSNRLGLQVDRMATPQTLRPVGPQPRKHRVAKPPMPRPVLVPKAPDPHAGLPLFHAPTAIAAHSKTIIEVGFGECRYMPAGSDLCCARKTGGGVWCTDHARLVYAPSKSRRAA